MYTKEENTFLDFLRWRVHRIFKKTPDPEDYAFPMQENDPSFLRANTTLNTVTWIGHATLLLQLGGKNILTDPHFSDRASPVQWAGPKRVAPPGIALKDLPPIDIVLISHDHYDALDTQTVDQLIIREGGRETMFFVPLGLGGWLKKRGARNVVELDWWESYALTGMRIIAAPVQHWSKRALFGKNRTLWSGWIVMTDTFRFFFAGDTGYAPLFKEIGKRYGPFDLAAIPIGAYEPRWFMAKHHVSPEESVTIHQDVGSKLSVAIHWGTFILTDEPLDQPPGRLKKAMKDQNIAADKFLILQHGETIILENH